MRYRSSVIRLPVVVSLAMFLIIPATVEAGITIKNPQVQQTGDPHTQYDFSVYLSPGDTINPLTTSITLNNLVGINYHNLLAFATGIQINNSPSGLLWVPTIDSVTYGPSSALPTGSYYATSLTFTFLGFGSITAGSTPLLLGNFSISDDFYSIPAFTSSQVNVGSSITENGQTTNNPAFDFTVAPEPSSLVIVALAGSSLLAVGLLRRLRRAA